MTVVEGRASPGRTAQAEGGCPLFEGTCDRPVTCQQAGGAFSARVCMGFRINCARLAGSAGDEGSIRTRTEQCGRDRDM